MRVVVYSEGSGETAGQTTLPPSSGALMRPDQLGAAHFLVERCLRECAGMKDEVRFEGPLRDEDGRVARGSTLRTSSTLRRLLTWPNPTRRPDLAVVLVDSGKDNDAIVKHGLEVVVQGLHVKVVIGVARPEFEAWLIVDCACAASVLGATLSEPPDPEKLGPSEAKEILNQWIGQHGGLAGHADPKARKKDLRLKIAKACNLDTLARRCRSFELFLKDLIRDWP